MSHGGAAAIALRQRSRERVARLRSFASRSTSPDYGLFLWARAAPRQRGSAGAPSLATRSGYRCQAWRMRGRRLAASRRARVGGDRRTAGFSVRLVEPAVTGVRTYPRVGAHPRTRRRCAPRAARAAARKTRDPRRGLPRRWKRPDAGRDMPASDGTARSRWHRRCRRRTACFIRDCAGSSRAASGHAACFAKRVEPPGATPESHSREGVRILCFVPFVPTSARALRW